MTEDEEEAVILLSRVVAHSCEDDYELQAERLKRLVLLSRHPDVRRALAIHDAVSALLPCIIEDRSSLLLLLQLLRNLCAGESLNQEAFINNSGVHSVALVVDRTLGLQRQGHADIVSTLKLCIQLLGNVCEGGVSQRDAVWKTFFPDRFRALALLKANVIMEPLCKVIFTCSHEDLNRLEDLCRSDGALLISVCFQALPSHGGPFCKDVADWIYLVILDLCSRKSLVPQLFNNLRISCTEDIEEAWFSSDQVTLLGCLVDLMDGKEIFLDIVQQNKIDLPSLVEFLAHILKEASHFYLESDIHVSRKLPTTTGPSGIPVIDVMGYTLELLKVISGFDCWDSKLDSMSFRKSIIDGLLQNHVIELCLELLKRLGPPELIYRAMQHSNPGEGSVQTAIDHAEHFLRMTRVTLPYRGFRRDLVSIIGNAAYGSQTVQDAVRSQGGLFLLLQQCVVDEENPFLKEWGLWAVRNLVHDNTENAKEIGTLQLRGSFTPVELAEKGYKVEMDVALGRPKLINLSPGC